MAKQRKKSPVKKGGGNFPFRIHDIKIIGVLLAVFIAFLIYHIVFKGNISIQSEKFYIYIPAKSTASDLADLLKEKNIIRNRLSLKVYSNLATLKPSEGGLFYLEKDWNNYQIIDNLNNQVGIPGKEIRIPSLRHRSSLLKIISNTLDLDKNKFRTILKDSALLSELSFTKESIYCIFIPGTYFVPENSTEEQVIRIMHEEFLNFWNSDRREKAQDAKLDPIQATILASIVYAETKNYEEMPVIAGVYINRLKNKMRLESDPTLVYASGDFNARRVYKNKKMLYPAYNTYLKKGLPPGPIYFPPVKVIDAVLNYEEHDYIYFCAKDDSTGCHNFANSFEEHKENANRYREFLNSKKIFQ